LERIGLPPSETAPYAWLGVPLITSDQTVGCLAVFSISPDVAFNPGDRDLLITLSGQVSVAIENALLYNQTQGRAAQLENLNRISSLITASLDPEEVLAQVCRSVTQVSGGQRSAIFLINPDQGEVRLAYAHELSADFVYEHRNFPMVDDIRTRCLRTGRPALTPDINSLPQNHSYKSTLENEDVQALGDFPLITPRGQIGFLSVYFDQPHAFNPEEVEILQTFASQAAIAVSNARLHAQTDMALSRRAHQLAILENIGRELAAATHSGRLFEIILDYALEFTNSPWGSLNIYDPNTKMIEIKASRGYQLEKTAYSEMEGIAGRVIHARQAENINDVTQDINYIDLTGGAALSQLSVPLVHEDKVLGVLTLESPKQNAFTENDQSFISQLATQAAIALVNASLYDETRRRLKDQASLYSVTKRLVGNLSLEHVIRSVIQAIDETLAGQATGIYLWDDKSGVFVLRASTENESDPNAHLPPFIEDTLWKRVKPIKISTGLLQITHELAEAGPFLGNCQRCQALILPLEISDQPLGLILSHLPQGFLLQEEDLQLPRSIAAQGAIAIQNALLFSDVMKGRERLEAVLDSVEEGVLMVNANGVIILGNASVQKIADISLDDILGKSLTQLPTPIQRALGLTPKQAENLIETLGTDRRGPPSKITIKNANEKSDKVLERFIAPVMGQGRRPIGWVFVLRDISEEHQLNQARELITETLVHDLRSPMGAVSSALTLLEDVLPDGDHDEITFQSIDIAQRSTNRVMSLIESLLDISRMEAGSIHLELSTFNLHSLSVELFAEFKPQANDLGILLRNDVKPSTPHVHADREKITRVLTNLIDNALKFTPEGGIVMLSTETLSNQILAIKVSDNGPGIPNEFREQIFERFTQVPGLRGRRRGSGIGLTFCRLAIEAHGGRIWVEPSKDEGSTFTFTLPIANTQSTAP
jgi:signal transduction histidine kinase